MHSRPKLADKDRYNSLLKKSKQHSNTFCMKIKTFLGDCLQLWGRGAEIKSTTPC